MALSAEDMQKSPGLANRVAVGELVTQLRGVYGDELDVQFYDPRSIFWQWSVIRHKMRGCEVTWLMDNQVLARGVPALEELCCAIDKVCQKAERQ